MCLILLDLQKSESIAQKLKEKKLEKKDYKISNKVLYY